MQGRKASIEGRPMKGRERSGSEPIKDFIASKFCNPARKKSFLDMVVDTKVTIKSDLENIEETPSFKFISHLPLVIETIKGQSTTFTCRLSHSDAPLKWFFCGQECLGDKYSITTDLDGIFSLSINPTMICDQGEYRAEIEGFVASTCGLRVIEVPGKPRSLALTDVNENLATLTWLEPTYDGNTALTHYQVEKWSVGQQQWTVVKTVMADEQLQLTDRSVEKGNSYRYRVRAANKVGLSEVDDSEDLEIHIKPNSRAPFTDEQIMLTGRLPDKTVRVGETLEYSLPVGGEPMPVATWVLNAAILTPSDIVNISVNRQLVELMICPAQKIHNGVLVLKLTNSAGELKLQGNVRVFGCPEKPTGPVSVEPLSMGKCQVSWQPSACAESDQITEYIVEAVENSDESGYFEVARTNGKTASTAVKGLKMTSNYKFRIKARNNYGLSDPLVGDKFHSVKTQKGLSSAPTQPLIEDWHSDSIDISWSPPDSDGGFEIDKYLVEMKETTARSWSPVGEFRDLTARIEGLKKGIEYHFRVIALNIAGASEPSVPSRGQKANSKLRVPFVELKCKEPTVVAGRPLIISVRFGGNPTPTLQWSHNNVVLGDSENFSCQYVGSDRAILTIARAERKHSGIHTVIAQNEAGDRTDTIRVTILGKPASPEGPIEVTDIKDDSCRLSWKPPNDDGGSPINYYEAEKMDEMTGVWQPAGKATQSDLKVWGLKKGQQYHFRIRAVNLEGSSDALQTSTTTLAKGQHEVPGKPGAPDVTSLDVDYVELSWLPPIYDGGLPITGYLVELKTKRANEWLKAADVKEPIPKTKISNLKEGFEYQFRVCAINEEGMGEMSDSSERFATKKPIKPKIDRDALQSMTVKCDQDLMYPAVVRGYPNPEMVWLCDDQPVQQTEDVVILMESDFTELLFKSIKRRHAGKYRLTATNCAGSDQAEFSVTVVDRPSIPNGPVLVEPKKTGEVLLSWSEPDHDGGTAITSYEVEKRLEESDRWTHCCKTLDTQTRISGLEVGRKFLFRVKAANRAGESEYVTTNSPFVVKNITLAPSKTGKPEIVDWTANSVDITWTRPEDYDTVAVDKYLIDQKGITGRWEKALEVAGTTTFATITNLVYGDEYQFRVTPVNHVGKAEASAPSAKVVIKPRFSPSINRSDLEDIVIRVNFRIKFSVLVMGEPAPNIEWQLDGNPVIADERVKVETQKSKSVLSIAKAKRNDSGRYKIIAKNQYGMDEAEVLVKVLGKPAPPEGPFELSNVTEDHLSLAWLPPLDDGGAPVEYYEVEEFDSTKGNQWLMCGRTKFPKFLVESLVKSHHYKFRVRAVNQEGSSSPLEMKQSVQAKNQQDTTSNKPPTKNGTISKGKEEPNSSPSFTFKLRNRLIMPGVNCKLICHVTGHPLPAVCWFKDGRPVVLSDRLHMSNQDGICSLELFLCAKDDAGRYKCVATNPFGSDETEAELSIEEKKNTEGIGMSKSLIVFKSNEGIPETLVALQNDHPYQNASRET